MAHIETYSLIYGICIGTVATTLILIGSIIRDIIDSRKQTKREVRKAHDEGFAAGRKRRGYEKAWMEVQIEGIRDTISEIEKVQEKNMLTKNNKKRDLHIRIKQTEYDELRKIAKERVVPMSEVVRWEIAEYLEARNG